MLSDPILLAPTDTTVRVVWFTESPGERHGVELGGRLVPATTTTGTRRMPINCCVTSSRS